jgi:predicted ribosome quality control (RQC) complex YloA/Tae2 family protein
MVKKEIIKVTQNTLSGEIEKEYTILIGQNSHENTLLVKESEPEDIWFHLSTISSPHIILKTDNNKLLDQELLKQTASKLYKYKKKHNFDNAIYTQVKNVKLTSTPGLVVPSNTTTINYVKLKKYLNNEMM